MTAQRAGFLAAIITALLVVLYVSTTNHVDGVDDRLSNVEKVLRISDGASYATLVGDPMLAHPERHHDRAEAAYRAQRVVPAAIAWVLAGGRRSHAGQALAVIAIGGAGLLAFAVGTLSEQLGGPALVGFAAAFLPGSVASSVNLMPDAFAVGVAIFGFVMWLRHRYGVACWFFCIAALSRETTLIVPFALLLAANRGRKRLLVVPFVTYGIWVVVLRLRLHAWAFATSRRVALFGLIDSHRFVSAVNIAIALGIFALMISAIRRDVLGLMIVGTIALVVIMPQESWERWIDFSRVLLLGCVLASVRHVAPKSGVAAGILQERYGE